MANTTTKNRNLHAAKRSKNDEFYTQLADIENELFHYKHHFYGKVVYCNCDDPFESNFFKFFATSFEHLGLKKLIGTGYCTSPIMGKQLPLPGMDDPKSTQRVHRSYALELNGVLDINGDGAIDLNDIKAILKRNKDLGKIIVLRGDTATDDGSGVYPAGDFRSQESIRLLRQADIVVTNPPFSLFREYVAQLIEYDKRFLIIGNQNAITYKEIFLFIKENKIWLGIKSGDMKFVVPSHYEERTHRSWRDECGTNWRSLGNACWFTNLDHSKRHENLILWKRYHPDDYPKYDNYHAINVNKVAEIPVDYDGAMGVPITFLDKYNPKQFEIIGQTHSGDDSNEVEILRLDKNHRHRGLIDGRQLYSRILIKHKHPKKQGA